MRGSNKALKLHRTLSTFWQQVNLFRLSLKQFNWWFCRKRKTTPAILGSTSCDVKYEVVLNTPKISQTLCVDSASWSSIAYILRKVPSGLYFNKSAFTYIWHRYFYPWRIAVHPEPQLPCSLSQQLQFLSNQIGRRLHSGTAVLWLFKSGNIFVIWKKREKRALPWLESFLAKWCGISCLILEKTNSERNA